MDKKSSIVIEVEPTLNGYKVSQVIGLEQRVDYANPPSESTKIQISFSARVSPTVENKVIPANYIKGEQSPQPKHSSYEVYPHTQLTPNMTQSMMAIEVQKEEDKDTHLQPEEKTNTGAQQLNLMEIKRYPMVFPSCTQWFDINTIHEIEQQSLPEYFCGKYNSKTPQTYMEYRNYIIKLYRINPHGYLSATTCRRHLAGDVCGIFRIHAFLEHWGIINFNVDPYLKPHKATMIKVEGMDAESVLNMEEAKKESKELNATLNTSSKHPNCSYCGQICSFIWFKYKVSSITLCESCFERSKQADNVSAKDFEVCTIEPPIIENDPSEWTQEELLALLNCIENHKDEWDKTVQEMSILGYKRSKEDCIAKFLGLPISESQSSKASTAISETTNKRPGNNCFYDVSNPIFIQIGLFAKELEHYTNEEAKKAYSLRKQGVEGEQKTLNEYHMLSKEVVEKIKNKTTRRAKKLARKEMKEIRRLVGLVLEAQMKKVECKMDFFNEFDSLLHSEKQQIKALQAQVFAERLNLSMVKSEFLLQGRRRSFDNSRKESIMSEQKALALSPK